MWSEGIGQKEGQNRTASRLQISRELAKALGQEIVEILKSGRYITASGKHVDVQGKIHDAVRRTVSHPPEVKLPAVLPRPV